MRAIELPKDCLFQNDVILVMVPLIVQVPYEAEASAEDVYSLKKIRAPLREK